jgi:hypothetical protein
MEGTELATASYWAPLLESIADIAFAIVIVALAVELVPGRIAKRFERQIEAARELRIAELNNETVRLRKQLAPRRLTAEQKELIAEKLKAFAGTAFAMSAVGPEPIDFAIDTADALKAAEWKWVPWSLPGIQTNLPGRVPVGSIALFGTEIQVFNPKLANAGNALLNALVGAGYEEVRTGQGAAPAGADPNTILIMIGTKRQ